MDCQRNTRLKQKSVEEGISAETRFHLLGRLTNHSHTAQGCPSLFNNPRLQNPASPSESSDSAIVSVPTQGGCASEVAKTTRMHAGLTSKASETPRTSGESYSPSPARAGAQGPNHCSKALEEPLTFLCSLMNMLCAEGVGRWKTT